MAQWLWLYSCLISQYVYYEFYVKWGQVVMDDIGILFKFEGIVIYDFWKSYYCYGCEYGLCNVYLLRELIFVKECYK